MSAKENREPLLDVEGTRPEVDAKEKRGVVAVQSKVSLQLVGKAVYHCLIMAYMFWFIYAFLWSRLTKPAYHFCTTEEESLGKNTVCVLAMVGCVVWWVFLGGIVVGLVSLQLLYVITWCRGTTHLVFNEKV